MQVKRVTPAGQAHAAGIVGGAQHFIWSGGYSSGAAARQRCRLRGRAQRWPSTHLPRGGAGFGGQLMGDNIIFEQNLCAAAAATLVSQSAKPISPPGADVSPHSRG